MNQDIFVDGIGSINVTGNIVRIDLATLQPQLQSENGQPVFATSQRIVIPLEGFIQGIALQQNIMQQLIQTGVLQVNTAPNATGTPVDPVAQLVPDEAAATIQPEITTVESVSQEAK